MAGKMCRQNHVFDMGEVYHLHPTNEAAPWDLVQRFPALHKVERCVDVCARVSIHYKARFRHHHHQ